MLRSRGTEALIALEDAGPDVLFEKLPDTGAHIWPLIRMDFAAATAEVELSSIAVPRTMTPAKRLGRLARAYLPHPLTTLRRAKSADICYIVGGVTVRHTLNGSENWLVDAFARQFPDSSLVVQDRPFLAGSHSGPRFRNTVSIDPLLARVDVATKFAPMSSAGQSALRRVIWSIADELDFPLDKERIARMEFAAIYRLSRARHVERQYRLLLDRVNPRVVVMEDASYGSKSTVISMLKDRGIAVLEPQHGWIGPSHGAYNFGAAMSNPELKRTLPNAVLTFGDFWGESIRHPADLISIGKPHMDEMTRDLPALNDRPKRIVIVSSVAEPDQMSDFTLTIRHGLDSTWKVLYRPHPSERASLGTRYPKLVGAAGVEFDVETDVYETMRSARAVVGVASTVLYEALAMGCHVFVKDSPFTALYIDEMFGEPVSGQSGVQRIVDALRGGTMSSVPPHVLERVWKPGAVGNFRHYVDELLGSRN